MKTRRVLLWIVAALVSIAGVFVLLKPNTTTKLVEFFGWGGELYEGHSARYWIKALDNPDEEARLHAIHGLGALGPDGGEAVPALAKILVESPSRADRVEASLALGKMVPASRTAVPALVQALEGEDLWVRMNAAMALRGLGADAREAVPALIRALKDKANQTNLNTFLFTIQHQVALALGKASAGTAQGVPALMEALQALREEKRYAETSRMKPAAEKKPREQLYQKDAQAARSPSRARNSPDPVLGVSTVGLLGSIQGQGPYLATSALIAGSTLKTKPVKTILEIIESKTVCARALGEVGPEARTAVPLLRTMLQEDQVSDFKYAAQEALQKIEGKTE